MQADYVVEGDEDYISDPCYCCPHDNPRLCDCEVCRLDEYDDELEDFVDDYGNVWRG